MIDTERSTGRQDRILAITSLVAAVAFVIATVVAARGEPSAWEIASFEAVNDLPDWMYVVIWPFMQYGVFVTIPITTVIAWRLRHHRLAVLLAVSGVGIYVLAKIVKRVADRGRPDAFLDTVNEREEFAAGSLGYTSGHVAVAATIATLTLLHLPKRWGQVSVVLVAIVALGRMYVGAHLPLDMIGGVAMGVAAGTAATYVSHRVDARSEHR